MKQIEATEDSPREDKSDEVNPDTETADDTAEPKDENPSLEPKDDNPSDKQINEIVTDDEV